MKNASTRSDNRFNAALRKCITSKRIVAKISRLTEEAQVKRGTRLKSRQILFCLIEYLRPDGEPVDSHQ